MRYGAIPETPDEQHFVESTRFARAHMDAFVPLIQAQAIMTAVRYGVFETLGRSACRANELAQVLRVNADTLELMLRLLRTADYLTIDADRRYSLTQRSRAELLEESSDRVAPVVTVLAMWWNRLAHMDRLLETGTGLDLHNQMRDPREWAAYQSAMLALARRAAPMVATAVPVKPGATRLLDIAGSHGLFGALIARAHPPMRAEVLDLPQAVDHARQLGHAEGLDDLVTWRAGDALTDDLGDGYDVVFLGNILHHFAPPEISHLLSRASKAMTTDGTIAIFDIRAPDTSTTNVIADASTLFFRLTSTARLYGTDDYTTWLTTSGFTDIHAETGPGFILVTGRT
jgi:2-polyprenyl-3-methyl-5-hydroxy-6-metoxy-1,4-benzoquinol methylase